METMNVKITFTEAILGTWPNNPDIAAEYIATKAPNYDDIEKELDALPAEDQIRKSMTDEEYARYMRDLRDASEREHRRNMRRYKARLLFEALSAIALVGIIFWIIEVLA